MMLGRLFSFWNGPFPGDMFIFGGGVYNFHIANKIYLAFWHQSLCFCWLELLHWISTRCRRSSEILMHLEMVPLARKNFPNLWNRQCCSSGWANWSWNIMTLGWEGSFPHAHHLWIMSQGSRVWRICSGNISHVLETSINNTRLGAGILDRSKAFKALPLRIRPAETTENRPWSQVV